MYRYLFWCRSANPFWSEALIFVATSHWTHYVTSSGQQEG